MLDNELTEKPARSLSSLSLRPNNIRFANQNTDEHVVLFIRQHKIILYGYIFQFIVLLFIPVIIYILINILFSIPTLKDIYNNLKINFDNTNIYIVSTLLLYYSWCITIMFKNFLYWFYNAYIVTSQRLIDLDFLSVLNHAVKELDLRNIEDAVDTHIGILQTIFDMGRVVVSTASERTTFALDNVPKSSQVRDFIMDLSIHASGKK